MPEEGSALSRRAFVEKLATGAAVVCAAGLAAKGTAAAVAVSDQPAVPAHDPLSQGGNVSEGHAAMPPSATQAAPEAPPPWELLSPLRMGSSVGHGWRVAELSSITNGACVLTLANARGRTHRVHVCANDGRPAGLVYTTGLDLVVMNGGRGDVVTDETLAQAVASVAHVLADNERRAESRGAVAQLRPHAERLATLSATAKLR